MLIGDVNGDKTVNNTDISLTRGQVGMAVTNANFREDVRISGTITSADVRQVKGPKGHSCHRHGPRRARRRRSVRASPESLVSIPKLVPPPGSTGLSAPACRLRHVVAPAESQLPSENDEDLARFFV